MLHANTTIIEQPERPPCLINAFVNVRFLESRKALYASCLMKMFKLQQQQSGELILEEEDK